MSPRPDGKDPRGPKWRPMQRAEPVPKTDEQLAVLDAEMARQGVSEQGRAKLIAQLSEAEMWINDRYVVSVERRPDGSVYELSVRRQDRKAVHDWRDLQRIKTEVAGAETEAVELYPAESRLMDTANQYYLYCLPPGERIEVGYNARNVSSAEAAERVGAVQRQPPADWLDYDPADQSYDRIMALLSGGGGDPD